MKSSFFSVKRIKETTTPEKLMEVSVTAQNDRRDGRRSMFSDTGIPLRAIAITALALLLAAPTGSLCAGKAAQVTGAPGGVKLTEIPLKHLRLKTSSGPRGLK